MLKIKELTARSEAGVSKNIAKVKGGWGQAKGWLVGVRRHEVVGLTAVEAEPFVSTAILFLGGERAAAH